MTLSAELLGILVCPGCKGPVAEAVAEPMLVCRTCRIGFPIVDGIPVMLLDDAVAADEVCSDTARERQ